MTKVKKQSKPAPKKEADGKRKFNAMDHWKGMPEFTQESIKPIKSVLVHVYTKDDLLRLSRLLGQEIKAKTTFVNYPKIGKVSETDHRWSDKK